MNIPNQLVEYWAKANEFDPSHMSHLWKKYRRNKLFDGTLFICLSLILTFFLTPHIWSSETLSEYHKIVIFLALVPAQLLGYKLVGPKAPFGMNLNETMTIKELITDVKRLKKVAGVWRFKSHHFEPSLYMEKMDGANLPGPSMSVLATLCWTNLRHRARDLGSQQAFMRECRNRFIEDKKDENRLFDTRMKLQGDFDHMVKFGLRPQNTLFGNLFHPRGPVISADVYGVWHS